jgi:hypothetical protein
LQFFLLDMLDREVLVDDGSDDEKCLRKHLEFEVNIDYPIEQNGSHVFGYLGLTSHAVSGQG